MSNEGINKAALAQVIKEKIRYDGSPDKKCPKCAHVLELGYHWIDHKDVLEGRIIQELVRQTGLSYELFREIISETLEYASVEGDEQDDADYIANTIIEKIIEA